MQSSKNSSIDDTAEPQLLPPEFEPLRNGNGAVDSTGEVADIAIEADIADLVPASPDGGWGWVIVLSSFMNHFILDGICYAFGTLLQAYADHFNSTGAATGAIMSTLIGCYLLSGE